MALRCGVDRFYAEFDSYVGQKTIGLITNHSGVDAELVSTIDLLHRTGRLVALFGPEHGVRGYIQAGEEVGFHHDPKTGLPVYSLYGEVKKPTQAMLEGVDALVFDLQDVGCRFYTYLYTLLYALEAAAEFGLPIFVLDRPNPLGGEIVEGNILDMEYASFVGYPIPVRYGLTIGELARYFNSVYYIHADLTVVPLSGWKRDEYRLELAMNWVAPSPNIPKVDTAVVYPGTCFLEGTNLSEGRGTTQPFETVGAPFIDGDKLAKVLNSLRLTGVRFRPTSFTPTFSKYSGKNCQGVQLHVLDRKVFQPVRTGLTLIQTVAGMYEEFQFLSPSKGKHFFFDLLAGTDEVRKTITAGQSLESLFAKWEREQLEFREQSKDYWLY